jgi:hypothetical protein
MRDDFDDDDRGGSASDVILAFLLGGLTGAAVDAGRQAFREERSKGERDI